jgi:hypothetical protein
MLSFPSQMIPNASSTSIPSAGLVNAVGFSSKNNHGTQYWVNLINLDVAKGKRFGL